MRWTMVLQRSSQLSRHFVFTWLSLAVAACTVNGGATLSSTIRPDLVTPSITAKTAIAATWQPTDMITAPPTPTIPTATRSVVPTATQSPIPTALGLPRLQAVDTYPGGSFGVISPTGCCLITAIPDGGVSYYDLTTHQERWSFYAPKSDLSLSGFFAEEAVSFSPDGGRVAVGGAEEQIYLLDAYTGQLIAKQDHGSFITELSFLGDGSQLAASGCGESPGLTVWDLSKNSIVRFPVFGCPMVSVPGEFKVVLSGLRDVSLFNANTGEIDRVLTNGRGSGSLAASPDGASLAAEYHDRLVIWLLVSGVTLPELDVNSLQGQVRHIAWSDNNYLAVLDADGRIIIWDMAVRLPIASGQVPTDTINISFSPDGNLLITSRPAEVQLWSMSQ